MNRHEPSMIREITQMQVKKSMRSMPKSFHINSLFTILWLSLFVASCSGMSKTDWPAISVQVIDEATGQPLSDVIVVARWEGVAAYSTSVCFHVESTTTDTEGKYYFPAWRNEGRFKHANSQRVTLLAYKKGYEMVGPVSQQRIRMKPFAGTREERLEYLGSMVNNSCFSEKERSLLLLTRALHQEAVEIAVTKSEQETARSIKYYLDVLELGWDKAHENYFGK